MHIRVKVSGFFWRPPMCGLNVDFHIERVCFLVRGGGVFCNSGKSSADHAALCRIFRRGFGGGLVGRSCQVKPPGHQITKFLSEGFATLDPPP